MKRRSTLVAVLSVVLLSACGSKDEHANPIGAPDSSPALEDAITTDSSSDMGAEVVTASCANMLLDPGEVDVDCGGPCPACDVGKKCTDGKDCVTKSCKSGACIAATCSDMILNGTETDLDCGGASCNPCDDGKKCTAPSHCKSGVCGAAGTCAAATCTDGVKNGTETDIDCGGGSCPKCGVGRRCNSALVDCTTGVCGLESGTYRCQCPSDMTRIGLSDGGGGTYCIDRIEVTADAYAAKFLSLGPDPEKQIAVCKSWNKDFAPLETYVTAFAGYPVRGIDWCDAYAYCQQQGKTLCGKIGGGSVPFDKATDKSQSQWYNACSVNGAYAYPYTKLASDYSGSTCNGYDAGFADRWRVIDPPSGVYQHVTCSGGPLADVYQLSGNEAEWEDSCDGTLGGADNCHVRGGSYKSSAADLRCDAPRAVRRDTIDKEIGFRCCL